MPNRAWGYKVE